MSSFCISSFEISLILSWVTDSRGAFTPVKDVMQHHQLEGIKFQSLFNGNIAMCYKTRDLISMYWRCLGDSRSLGHCHSLRFLHCHSQYVVAFCNPSVWNTSLIHSLRDREGSIPTKWLLYSPYDVSVGDKATGHYTVPLLYLCQG